MWDGRWRAPTGVVVDGGAVQYRVEHRQRGKDEGNPVASQVEYEKDENAIRLEENKERVKRSWSRSHRQEPSLRSELVTQTVAIHPHALFLCFPPRMAASEGASEFALAVDYIAASVQPSSTETKLRVRPRLAPWRSLAPSAVADPRPGQLYALYKIATVSARPSSSRPGVFDFQARAKYDAWLALGETDEYDGEGEEGKARARTAYGEVARELGWKGPGQGRGADAAGVERGVGEPEPKRQAVGGGGGGGGGGMASVSRMAEEPLGTSTHQPLHDLAVEGKADELRALLTSPSGSTSGGVDDRDEYGFTPLHLAADRGALRVLPSS